MKILVFNWRDITHPWAGGAERHLHELAKFWINKGHKVHFLVGGYKDAVKEDVIDGVKIKRILGTYTSLFILPIFYFFWSQKSRFDILIDTSHGLPFFLPLYTRKPIVLIIHHDHKKLWQTEFGGFLAKIGIFIEEIVTPLVYRKYQVVTLSETERELLKKKGFRDVNSIPPGVDKSFSLGKTKFNNPTILYLGRLRKYKRVDLLLDLYRDVKKSVKKAKLIIAGDGQDRRRLEYIVRKKKLNGDITFKGYVSEDEKIELLQKAWVLAFPSLMEGWGLVSMEAASCGTPTIGFKVPGVQDSVKDKVSGLLAGNKEEYKNYLEEILRNKKLRNKLSMGAYKWARNFTWEKSSLNFLKVLENVLNNKSKYGRNYFSSFLRGDHKRKFHPIYYFRIWYILNRLKTSR